ncbi:NAD-dependent protein deacylase [Moritella sp. 36]|uniref:Sir2 family NAD+-dependent deacetylase n=1 Tax=Moritella sp. 36 TaxID=2746233 RepID=UPI001BA7073F|nr:Sir2 family NAD+-dependent deacetylase [Moritella sp. 36]QUM89283.1 NAD-dependent protein deacylase [Moritella sp. 36]
MFDNYNNIVILTGSGISAESGIETFRASDGLWAKHHIDDIATLDGYRRDPELVYSFYNQRFNQLSLPSIQPNDAHIALAELQKSYSGNVSIITQNIDNLHERGGAENVIHMHGELIKARCEKTHKLFPYKQLNKTLKCPCCKEAGNLRPHVVWFNEMPLFMNDIYKTLSTADLFIAIGTSGSVYPAADFVNEAHKACAHTIEINLDSTHISDNFQEHRIGKATDEVRELVDELMARDKQFF